MNRTGTGLSFRASFLTVAAATAMLVGQFAAAQTAGVSAANSDDVLAEIIVTGTPIAQKILDTSFAVTVIDSETLKNSPALGPACPSPCWMPDELPPPCWGLLPDCDPWPWAISPG